MHTSIRKTVAILLTISICLFFMSCSNENNTPDTINNTNNNYYISFGYDDQICFDAPHIARTEEGYYFITGHYFSLHFFDLATQKTVIVCSKPDCLHNDMKCDASLLSLHSGKSLWYYNNKIYVMAFDEKTHTYYLCGISKDGSKRTRACDLLKIEPEEDGAFSVGGDIRSLTIHRGYAYFTVEESSSKISLFQIEVDKSVTPRVLYSVEGENPRITRLKGYRDSIYFQMYVSLSNFSPNPSASVYCFDSKTQKAKICIENQFYDYFPVGDDIYYSTDPDFSMLDVESGKKKIVYSTGYAINISYDGSYFYFDNLSLAIEKKAKYSALDLIKT